MTPAVEAVLRQLERDLTDRGMLIEAGWIGLRILWLPEDAPAVQVDELRNAFMAGVQHLFSSIMSILDPGEDPTDADLGRMELISDELDRFYEAFKLRHAITEGRA